MSAGTLSDEAIAYLEERHVTSLLEELFHDVLVHLPEDPLEFLHTSLSGRRALRMMVVGPAGCGKRTQCFRLAERYGAVHIHADAVFRREVDAHTAAGERIAPFLRDDRPIPDADAADIIAARLAESDAAAAGWVLDGFPRTRAQALHLQARGITPLLFIVLDAPRGEAVRRCAGRWQDTFTGKLYGPDDALPEAAQVERVRGEDEFAAAVVRRWKYFDARRDELMECYESFAVCIDGNRPADTIFEDICEQVDARYVSWLQGMIFRTPLRRRYRLFYPMREGIPLHFNPAKTIFPLINGNNLLAKPRNNWKDYAGRREFDEDHPLPVVGSRLNERTEQHRWNHWDQFLNPQITQSPKDLTPTPEYVGLRSGHNMIKMGWMKIGGSWKYARSYNDRRNVFARGQWQERKMTPRFMLAPRVSPGGPRNRYEGKLTLSRLKLSKLLWAIDTGRLNPNEVITLYHLRQANVIAEFEVVWPGFVLLAGNVERVPYPLRIELQNASEKTIRLIEEAGGTFTGVYMTHEGLYQTMRPEEFPVFAEQDLPERKGLESLAANPSKRGWLAQWYEDESKYAHPEAGRRHAHYVRPPTDRDFPATVEEYEMVKHHQKWHLNQPGTGTLLPWHSLNTADMCKRTAGRI